MTIGFVGSQETFDRLSRFMPGIKDSDTDAPDGLIVEDWAGLGDDDHYQFAESIRRGQSVLAIVSSTFRLPGLQVPMRWDKPPLSVVDYSGNTIKVEALGAFDFLTADDLRLSPGRILHKGADQGLITVEFQASSSSGVVIVSALKLLQPSIYSDETTRKAVLSSLVLRLPAHQYEHEAAPVSEDTDLTACEEWKTEMVVRYLLGRRRGTSPDDNATLQLSPAAQDYWMRLKDDKYMQGEVDRLLPYAFRRRLGL